MSGLSCTKIYASVPEKALFPCVESSTNSHMAEVMFQIIHTILYLECE
jgi:hypothetical protein